MKSIMDTEPGRCYLCGRITGTETHHIFSAGNRKLADADGMTVELCHLCHWRCHNGSESPKYRFELHTEGQKRWEETYGVKLLDEGKNPRAEFMKRYGRNYL